MQYYKRPLLLVIPFSMHLISFKCLSVMTAAGGFAGSITCLKHLVKRLAPWFFRCARLETTGGMKRLCPVAGA